MQNIRRTSVFVITLVSMLLVSCGLRTELPAKSAPFTISNDTGELGAVVWTIRMTNGILIQVQNDNVSLSFGSGGISSNLVSDSSLTAFFDPQTIKLQKTLLETPSGKGGLGYWIRDINADGIPDLRKIKGKNASEVFYEGRWYPSLPGDKNWSVLIDLDGKQTRLFLEDGFWRKSRD